MLSKNDLRISKRDLAMESYDSSSQAVTLPKHSVDLCSCQRKVADILRFNNKEHQGEYDYNYDWIWNVWLIFNFFNRNARILKRLEVVLKIQLLVPFFKKIATQLQRPCAKHKTLTLAHYRHISNCTSLTLRPTKKPKPYYSLGSLTPKATHA